MNYEESLTISYNRLFDVITLTLFCVVIVVCDCFTNGIGDMNYIFREVFDFVEIIVIFYLMNAFCNSLGAWGIAIPLVAGICSATKPEVAQVIDVAMILGLIYILYIYLAQPIFTILQLRKEDISMQFSFSSIFMSLLGSVIRLTKSFIFFIFHACVLTFQLILTIITFGIITY